MTETILVPIPVSPDVAALLHGDEARTARAGRLLDDALRAESKAADPFWQALGELRGEAREAGLTDEIVDEELAAHRAERRLRR